MAISPITLNTVKIRGRNILVSVAVSPFISFFFGSAASKDVIGAVCIGFTISLTISIADVLLSSRKIRWKNLFIELGVKTFLYLLLVAFFTFLFMYLFNMIGIKEKTGSNPVNLVKNSVFVISMVAGCLLTLFFIFINQMNNLLGQSVLPKLMTGHYHRPREEKRIFMFMDITSSTTIAEKIGHMRFLSLLDDFFHDITEAVLFTRGEIYKYVGDEAILVWEMKEGLKNANCILCFFMMRKRVEKEKEKYLRKYGLVPEFKAGLHCGTAVVGEMGLIKKEIAYIGDVVNTTARIEALCNTYRETFLASGDIVRNVGLPESVGRKDIGKVQLRGKSVEVELFAIFEK